jgi:hypothetical protein
MFPNYGAVRAIQAERYSTVSQDPRMDSNQGINRWEGRMRELASRISPARLASRLSLRESGQA